MSEKPIELTLMIDGKKKKFSESFVPASKMLEALDLIDVGNDVPLSEYYESQVKFVASVFQDKAVTKDSIFNGMNALDFYDTMGDIIFKIAGVDPKKNQTVETKD